MPTYKFNVFYVTTKSSTLTVDATSETDAKRKVHYWFLDQDTSAWNDCGEGDLEIELEHVLDEAQ